MSKRPIHSYVFNPSAATLDLSGIPGFDIRNLFAVIHLPTGSVIYAPKPGLGYSTVLNGVLRLQAAVGAMSASDPLLVIYDDGGKPAEDSSVQAIVTALATPAQTADVQAATAKIEAMRALLAAALTINLPAGAATAANQVATTNELAQIYNALLPLATDLDVQATTAKVEAVRALLAGTLKTAPQANAPRVSTTLALTAQGATVTLAVDGMATGVAQITGTWAGSVSWAGSIDGGNTYFAMNVTPFGAGGGASVGAATANGQWEFSAAGLTHVQATMTAFTSGSASVLLAASSGGKIARVKAPAGDPLPTLDQNNAPFTSATLLTAGQAAPAGKSVGVNATAGGTITLTLSGGGALALPVFAGWQTFPFAATAFALSNGATGSVYNLA